MYLGDFPANAVVTTRFTTRAFQSGVPTATANANMVVFKGNANLNVIDGVSLNAGSIAGVNMLEINTAANQTFYTTGTDFQCVFANGNVSGNSIAGEVAMLFSIQNRIVVTVTGNVAGSIQGGMNGNVGGNVNGDVGGNVRGSILGSMNGNVLGNVNGDVVGNVRGSLLGSMNGNVLGNVNGSTGSVVGNIGGNLNGNVNGSLLGSMNGNVLGNISGNVNGSVLGNLNGNVNGNVVGTVARVTGDVSGNLNGSVLGSLNGSILGNVVGSVGNILAGGAQFIADTYLDRADAIETGITPRLAQRYTSSAVAGNLTGGNSLTTVIKGVGGTTTRITAAVLPSGDTRTVTLS